MADDERNPVEDRGEDEPASTPFDHPLFLPVLLWGFTAWFGWDAWIVPMEEHLDFNRYGFFLLLALAVYFTVQSVREMRRSKGDGGSIRE